MLPSGCFVPSPPFLTHCNGMDDRSGCALTISSDAIPPHPAKGSSPPLGLAADIANGIEMLMPLARGDRHRSACRSVRFPPRRGIEWALDGLLASKTISSSRRSGEGILRDPFGLCTPFCSKGQEGELVEYLVDLDSN